MSDDFVPVNFNARFDDEDDNVQESHVVMKAGGSPIRDKPEMEEADLFAANPQDAEKGGDKREEKREEERKEKIEEADLFAANSEDAERGGDVAAQPRQPSPKKQKKDSPEKKKKKKKDDPEKKKKKKEKSEAGKEIKSTLTGAIPDGSWGQLLNKLYEKYKIDKDIYPIRKHLKEAAAALAERKRPYTIKQIGQIINKLSGGDLKYASGDPKVADAISLINSWVKQIGSPGSKGTSPLKKASPPKKAASPKRAASQSPKKAGSKSASPKKPASPSVEREKRKIRKEKEEADADAEIASILAANDDARYRVIKNLLKPIERKRGGEKPNPKLTITFLNKFRDKVINNPEFTWHGKWTKDRKITAIRRWIEEGMQAQYSPNNNNKVREVSVLLVLQATSGKTDKPNLYHKHVILSQNNADNKELDKQVIKAFSDAKGFKAVTKDAMKVYEKLDYVYMKKGDI